MFRLYTPIAILQFYCLFHAYRNKADTGWYLLIVFFPLVGSIIYLYKFVYNPQKIEQLGETIKQSVNKGHQIQKLEKELAFSDTVNNRMALAEQYLAEGFTIEAYEMYKSCHKGIYKDDLPLLLKLVQCSYTTEDYPACKTYGDLIDKHHDFRSHDAKGAYAWALYYTGETEKANELFYSFDVDYSSYPLRLEFVFYLLELDKEAHAIQTLDKMIAEFDYMDSNERKMKKKIYKHLLKVRSEIV